MNTLDYKRVLIMIYITYYSRQYQQSIDNNDNNNEDINQFESKTLYKDEYINELNILDRDNNNLNSNINDSISFYYENIEENDIGCVNLYELTLNDSSEKLYLVRVTTDGDDGWIELYGDDGKLLEYGRTYIEIIHFEDDIAKLRNHVMDFSYPEGMDLELTKWGTPLPWRLPYQRT